MRTILTFGIVALGLTGLALAFGLTELSKSLRSVSSQSKNAVLGVIAAEELARNLRAYSRQDYLSAQTGEAYYENQLSRTESNIDRWHAMARENTPSEPVAAAYITYVTSAKSYQQYILDLQSKPIPPLEMFKRLGKALVPVERNLENLIRISLDHAVDTQADIERQSQKILRVATGASAIFSLGMFVFALFVHKKVYDKFASSKES